MDYGRAAQQLTGAGLSPWIVAPFLAAALALLVWVPAHRVRVIRSLILAAIAYFVLMLLGIVLPSGAQTISAAHSVLLFCALFAQCVAYINITGLFAFEIVAAGRVTVPHILRDLLVAACYAIAIIALLSRLGVDLTGIIATSAVLTAVIGLSFQDTLGNVMGGMALQLEGTIRIGDWVLVDKIEGRVTEIRWRHTAIETRDWDTVVIPNSALMRSQVTVLGRRSGSPPQRRERIQFNVDYRYAPADVIKTVESALRLEPIDHVAREPPVNCICAEFKESYATYAVRYWLTDIAVNDPTNSVVRSVVYFALSRAGIPLSIPAQAVFLTQEDERRRERKKAEELERRLNALKRVELFDTLREQERQTMAERLSIAPFGRGEVLTKQGAEAHWLYLIIAGLAEVSIRTEDGLEKTVATLGAGDFFGELGLLTGEPRSATVTASTNVQCYRLEKGAFLDILKLRPEIASDISRVISRRKVEDEAARQELSEEARRNLMNSHHSTFLRKIRLFFKLDEPARE